MTWIAQPIGNVIKSTQYGLSLAESADGLMPIVGMKDIQNGRVSADPSARVDITIEAARDYLLSQGDILLNRTNSPDLVGKTGIYRDSGRAVFASYLVRLNLDRDKADPEFINQVLAGEDGQRQIKQLATRAVSQANINPTTFKKHFWINLPSLPEQVAIRDALLTWDDAIEKTKQLIAAKEERKAALAIEILTGQATQWPRVRLGDISERMQQQDPGGKHPLLTISSSRGFVRQEDKYSRNMAGESAKTYTLLNEGDFSYNKGNSLRYEFGCIYQLQAYKAALVPSVYVSFRLNEGIDHSYMRHLFASDYLKSQLRALVKTGVRNNGLLNISPAEFLSTAVPLPPIRMQQKIGRVLDSSQREIDLLQQQLRALRTQKSGLMKKLLTGQWRIPEKAQAA